MNARMETLSVSVERAYPSGGYRVSAIVRGYYVSRLFLGYSKRDAVRLFRAAVREGGRA